MSVSSRATVGSVGTNTETSRGCTSNPARAAESTERMTVPEVSTVERSRGMRRMESSTGCSRAPQQVVGICLAYDGQPQASIEPFGWIDLEHLQFEG